MKNFTAPNSAFSNDSYNLQRFLDAQEPVFEDVCRELSGGRKRTHWMWFIFPQIKGLGRSPMAEKFAISSREEAKAYLEHPVLGTRLRECARLVNAVDERSIEDIFEYPDYMKFRSSMTLFAQVAPDNEVFNNCLRKYFNGKSDPGTLAHLSALKSAQE
jgi:uncharacterized protein (DUF1810 family)